MNIKFFTYYFSAIKSGGKRTSICTDFETDFLNVLDYVKTLDIKYRKQENKYHKKFLFLYDYNYIESERTLLLEFKSAKYANIRKVVDTGSWKEQTEKKKAVKDGDEETTLLAIKFYDDLEAYCIKHMNSDGVGLSQIIDNLNFFIKQYHNDVCGDNISYKIETVNIISKDFLASLQKASRITSIKLCVDKKQLKISEMKSCSLGDDIHEEALLKYKPTGRGKSIASKTVKEIFDIHKNNKTIIKKIYIEGTKNDNSILKFDTECMKEVYNEHFEDTITGEPNISLVKKRMIGIFDQYK